MHVDRALAVAVVVKRCSYSSAQTFSDYYDHFAVAANSTDAEVRPNLYRCALRRVLVNVVLRRCRSDFSVCAAVLVFDWVHYLVGFVEERLAPSNSNSAITNAPHSQQMDDH